MEQVKFYESYESPIVEVIEVVVETGFATSDGGGIGDGYEEGGEGSF